jgi:hypothetical protein
MNGYRWRLERKLPALALYQQSILLGNAPRFDFNVA